MPTATDIETTPATPAATPDGVLLVADVARLLNVKETTIRAYVKESRPMVGTKPGRYAEHPFPQPRRMNPSTTLWWPESDRPAIVQWDKDRPTQSHGKGRQASVPRGPRRASK